MGKTSHHYWQNDRWAKSSPELRQKRLEANQRWRKKNAEKVRLVGRQLYAKHRDKRTKNSRDWYHKQVEKDPVGYRAKVAAKIRKIYRDESHSYHYAAMRRVYGVSREEYRAMFAAQQGLCAICHQPETLTAKGRVRRLCIDHCHATGRVRALLCHNCNVGIGVFRENPDLLRRAAEWMESQQSLSPAQSDAA